MESLMFWQRGRAWLICRTNTHLSTPPRIYGGGRVTLSFAGRKTVSEERFDPPPTAPIFDGRQNKQHCAGFILGRSCFCCHSEVWSRMSAKPILTRVGAVGVEGVLAAKHCFHWNYIQFLWFSQKFTASVCCWSVVMFGVMCAGIPGSTNRTRWCKNKQTKQRSPCKTPPWLAAGLGQTACVPRRLDRKITMFSQ